MSTVERRVFYLEGKVEEHSGAIGDLRGLIVALDQKVDRLIASLDQKVDRLNEKMDRRFDALEERFDRRFEAVDRRFNWVIGIQFSILVAIIAGLFGVLATLLRT